MNYIQENLDWFKSGKVGCTFASYFARIPDTIGWKFIISPERLYVPEDCFLLSIIFPEGNKELIKLWALGNGFFIEDIANGLHGLRYEFPEGISWVQYFGPDADVITRQCPYPMLTMTVKLSAKYYIKVGFKGILHIAHASIKGMSDFVCNRLWDTSLSNTEKQLGYKPTIREAAKTTYHV